MGSFEEFYARYGETIIETRANMGWSQRDLAAVMGVHRTTIQSWENGRNFPIARHRKKLDKIIELARQKAGVIAASVAVVGALL